MDFHFDDINDDDGTCLLWVLPNESGDETRRIRRSRSQSRIRPLSRGERTCRKTFLATPSSDTIIGIINSNG